MHTDQPNTQAIDALTSQVSELTRLVAQSESRYQKLARWNHRLLVGLAAAAMLTSVGVMNLATSQEAIAEPGVIKKIEQDVEQDVKAVEQTFANDRAKFDNEIEQLRSNLSNDLKSAENMVSNDMKYLAVLLYDVKKALEAVPQMAHNMDQMNQKMNAMPMMAADMRQMSANMAVMTYGINSTMGRMGRVMPW